MTIERPVVTATGNNQADRDLLAALRAMRRGDFSARLPQDWEGRAGDIAPISGNFR